MSAGVAAGTATGTVSDRSPASPGVGSGRGSQGAEQRRRGSLERRGSREELVAKRSLERRNSQTRRSLERRDSNARLSERRGSTDRRGSTANIRLVKRRFSDILKDVDDLEGTV